MPTRPSPTVARHRLFQVGRRCFVILAGVFLASIAVGESAAEERLSVDGFKPRSLTKDPDPADRSAIEAFSQAYATAGRPRVLLRISGSAIDPSRVSDDPDGERRVAGIPAARREVERGVSRLLRLGGASLIPTSADSAATSRIKARRDGDEWTVRAELGRFLGSRGGFVLTVSGVRLADESPIGTAASLELNSDANLSEAAQRVTLDWMRSVGGPGS